jgi:hypothetical protein
MKRFLCLTALLCLLAPFAFSQNSDTRAEVGVFGDYFRLAPASTNFYGVGGRLGFNLAPHIQLEGETAYDFTENFSTSIPCTGSPCPPPLISSSLHVWHGQFGPKIQTRGPFHLFAFAKGGFVNFAGGNPSFPRQVGTFGSNATYGSFYPGGGIEAFLGKVGLRLDIGDEMFFNNGAQNNLKITFGPSIRF